MTPPEPSSRMNPNDAESTAALPLGAVGITADTVGTDATPSSGAVAPPPREAKSRRCRGKKKTPAAAGPPPTAPASEQKLMHLVIDSGAIIKGAGMTLASAAENFWTVPEVVAEVRDKKARHHLESLPFELKLREPSDEAMKFAANFARQTGDLRSLSRVDLRVIALTYMLERQETGAAHLRTAPLRAGTKVNNNSKGVAKPSLAPANDAKELSANFNRDAAHQEPKTTGVDAASGGKLSEGKVGIPAATTAAAAVHSEKEPGEVESLCAAVKKVWTDEVGARDAGDLQKEARRVGGEQEDSAKEGSDSDCDSVSDGDDEEEEDQEEGEEEEKEAGKDVGDDDEWEPEGNNEESEKLKDGSTTANAPFSADDFPSLGGGSNPVDPAAPTAAAAPAASPGPTPSPAAAASTATAKAPADASTSSWSLMARSNPEPFKVPVKADPAPLPAATTAVLPPTADSAGHFSTPRAAPPAAGATAARPRPDDAKIGTSRILSTAAAFGVSGGGAAEDDGKGWINPSNIKSLKATGLDLGGSSQTQTKGRSGGKGAVVSQCRAGCVTTDFAMQNVMMQVGLPLLSLDGMAIRRIKQWILRCAACFKTCTEMGRLFCPVCGNASLDRVSCSVNARTGATYVHLRKNHKVNLRGSKFSIPAPDPTKGRFEGDLLLREDQLLSGIWAQKTRRKEKDVSSMFGEDITGNVGLTVSRSADIVVGYGRKNPNAARGRERRGKKGVKKRL